LEANYFFDNLCILQFGRIDYVKRKTLSEAFFLVSRTSICEREKSKEELLMICELAGLGTDNNSVKI